MKQNISKLKSNKKIRATSSGLARVVLCRSSPWSSSGFGGFQSWNDSFYDFSKPLEMILSAGLAEGRYDGDFFILDQRFKPF
jgi:hypothetical protein